MELNQKFLKNIFNKFNQKSEFIKANELTSGNINSTFLVETSTVKYVLQQINSFVFKNTRQLISNKVIVSDHIQAKLSHLKPEQLNRKVLRFAKTAQNNSYVLDKEGNYWLLSFYIEGSILIDKVDNKMIANEAGKLIGEFLEITSDVDVNLIEDTLPNFHKMSFRFEQFDEALKNASKERLKLAENIINKIQLLKEEMHTLQHLFEQGKIPVRVTHNDTKITNLLFDKNNKGLCVIDTDTVMKGIIHYDFGDAVRTICSSTTEDNSDLNSVKFNLDYYQFFVKGFLKSTFKNLSKLDIKYLPLAAKTITFIMGLRFITDYLNNDIYFKTSHQNNNLERAENQLKLVSEIALNFNEIISKTQQEYKKLIQN